MDDITGTRDWDAVKVARLVTAGMLGLGVGVAATQAISQAMRGETSWVLWASAVVWALATIAALAGVARHAVRDEAMGAAAIVALMAGLAAFSVTLTALDPTTTTPSAQTPFLAGAIVIMALWSVIPKVLQLPDQARPVPDPTRTRTPQRTRTVSATVNSLISVSVIMFAVWSTRQPGFVPAAFVPLVLTCVALIAWQLGVQAQSDPRRQAVGALIAVVIAWVAAGVAAAMVVDRQIQLLSWDGWWFAFTIAFAIVMLAVAEWRIQRLRDWADIEAEAEALMTPPTPAR